MTTPQSEKARALLQRSLKLAAEFVADFPDHEDVRQLHADLTAALAAPPSDPGEAKALRDECQTLRRKACVAWRNTDQIDRHAFYAAIETASEQERLLQLAIDRLADYVAPPPSPRAIPEGYYRVVPIEPTIEMVHLLCGGIDIARKCQRCPLTEMTEHGEGQRGCVALAIDAYQAAIAAAPAPPSGGVSRRVGYFVRYMRTHTQEPALEFKQMLRSALRIVHALAQAEPPMAATIHFAYESEPLSAAAISAEQKEPRK